MPIAISNYNREFIVIHKIDSGGYWGEITIAPGCVTEGGTIEELEKNLCEALISYVAANKTESNLSEKQQYIKPMSGLELIELLEKNGWSLQFVNGKHYTYTKEGQAEKVSFPVHGDCLLEPEVLRYLSRFVPEINGEINIEIDDLPKENSSGSSAINPVAILHYPNGDKETIDIIASVKNNPASIGHPAILLAIRRWQEITKFHSGMFNDAYGDIPRLEIFKEISRQRDALYKLAPKYLERIGKALVEGAKKGKLSRGAALNAYIKDVDLDKDTQYLHQVWQILHTNEALWELRNESLRWECLEKEISGKFDKFYKVQGDQDVQEPQSTKGGIFLLVEDFLNSPFGASFLTRRCDWPEFRNSFFAWRFKLAINTIKDYLSEANKDMLPNNSIDNFSGLMPNLQNTYTLNELGNTLHLPVIRLDISNSTESSET